MDDSADVSEGCHNEDAPVREPEQVCSLRRQTPIYPEEVCPLYGEGIAGIVGTVGIVATGKNFIMITS